MDSADAYHRINTIKQMAVQAGDNELVLEALLGECSYLLYGNLNKSQYYYSALYGRAHNSDLYITKLTKLLQLAEAQDNMTMQVRTHILLGLEYHERNNLISSLMHFSKFYTLIHEIPFEQFPTKKHFLLYMGKFYYQFEAYKDAEKYLLYAQEVPPSYMIHEEADVFNTMGLIKRQLKEYDSAIYYFTKGQEVAWKQGSTTWRHILGGNIGIVYYLRGEYKNAKPLLINDINTSLERNDYSNAINSIIKLADIYYHQKIYDSAFQYAETGRWAVDSVRPAYKYKVELYRLMGELAVARGDMKKAYLYSDSAMVARDSLDNDQQVKQLMLARHQLETNINNSEVAMLRSEKRISILLRNSLIGGFVLLSAIVFMVIYIRNKQKQNKEQMSLAALYNAQNRLADFTKTVHEKNALLETSEQEITRLKEKLDNYGTKEQSEDIIPKLQNSTILTDDEWEDFRQLFEQVHSGFLYRLREKFPNLSPAETRFIALSKLKLDTKEMTNILGVSSSTVRTHKYRLRKKLNLADDESFSKMIDEI